MPCYKKIWIILVVGVINLSSLSILVKSRYSGAMHFVLESESLKPFKSFNYVGVLIDNILSYRPHCTRLLALCTVTHLRHLKKFMDMKLALIMYKQMTMHALW